MSLPLQQGNKSVSTNEIANYLSMKPSSVSDMLKKLAEKMCRLFKI